MQSLFCMQNPAENSSYDEAVSEESGGVLDHSSQLWTFSIITQRTILAARRYTDSQTPAGIWQRRSWTAVHRQLGVPKSRQHLQIQMCTFREQEWAALWSCCSPRRVYSHASIIIFACPVIALCSFLYTLISQSKLLHTSLTMGKLFLLQEEKNADPQLKYPVPCIREVGKVGCSVFLWKDREDRGLGREWYHT